MKIQKNILPPCITWKMILVIMALVTTMLTTCSGGFLADSDNADEFGKPVFNTKTSANDSLENQ